MQSLEKETAVYCKMILLNHLNWRGKWDRKPEMWSHMVLLTGWNHLEGGISASLWKPSDFLQFQLVSNSNFTKPTMKYYRRLHPLTSFTYRLHSFFILHIQLIIFTNCNTVLDMLKSFKRSSISELLPSWWRFKITLKFNMYPKECGTKAKMIVLLWILLQELDFLQSSLQLAGKFIRDNILWHIYKKKYVLSYYHL